MTHRIPFKSTLSSDGLALLGALTEAFGTSRGNILDIAIRRLAKIEGITAPAKPEPELTSVAA